MQGSRGRARLEALFLGDASLPVYEGQLFSNLNDGWTRGYCPASADWLKNWGVRSKQSSMLVNERNDPILCRHDLLLRWNSCNILFLKRISTLARPNPNRRAPITLTQGDRIHHPHHGIGKVRSIRRRSFSGKNGARFAEIYFKRERMTLMLREHSLDETIRSPIGPSRAEKLLDHMKSWKTKFSNQWKARANAHQALMDEGDPTAYAKVYKSLREREQKDTLSSADRKHLKRCTEFLSEELANALGQTTDEALHLMTQATRI